MNEPKHALAALRRIIGLEQKQLALLVGCSLPTIQAIEYRKLKLSEKLGEKISCETGVGLDWLMASDPTKPAVDASGAPYSKATFEKQRAWLETKVGENAMDAVLVPLALWQVIAEAAALASSAVKRNKFQLFRYKYKKSTAALEQEFGCDAGLLLAGKHLAGVSGDEKTTVAEALEENAVDAVRQLFSMVNGKVKERHLPAVQPSPRPPRRRASR